MRSIRAKFLFVGVAAVLLSVVVNTVLRIEESKAVKEQFRSNAADISHQAAFMVAPLVAFESRDALREALEALRANPDLAYTTVFDMAGAPLATTGPPSPRICNAARGQEVVDRGSVVEVTTPIVNSGHTWGCLQLGVSLVRARRMEAKQADIAMIAEVLIMLITILGGVYLAHSVAAPVARLAENVSGVERGDWDTEIDVRGRDEVAQLARGIQSMIREVRASKAYADDILQSMADSLLVIDGEGRIRTANPAAYTLLRYEDGTLPGEAAERIVPELKSIRTMRAGGTGSAGAVETEYVTRDGLRIPVLTSMAPMRQRCDSAILMAQDLRDRKRFESELLQAKDAAESANRAKSTFLTNMSHEIRTPLNAVLGYAQLMLRDSGLSAGAKESLKIITRSGEHLLSLINDILDMARIEAGKVTLSPAVFDLHDLISDLEAMFRLRAESKGLLFEAEVAPDCERYLEADKGKIRQVLTNLLGNAIKFTDAGSVTLRVSTNRLPDGQLRLKAVVEDSGAGIAAAEQSRLFRPFSQSKSGHNRQGGTGLGLAISREFVRLMNGDITMLSEPGEGAAFSFDIGVASARTIAQPRQSPRRRVLGLQPGAKAPSVLVADDEPNNRGWLTKLLTLVGFSVREARDGAEAVEIWREWKPDLVLLDMRMPVLGGMEAARRIRAHEGGTKTVILTLTANALEENRGEAIGGGVDDFLLKPCSEDEILGKVQEHLGVEYVYEEEPVAMEIKTTSARSPPSSETFRQLPLETIDELKQAVRNGEKDRMNFLIARMGERDAQAADFLRRLADDYEYDALQTMLERIPREAAA